MVDVRATEESMVQRLRLGEGKSTDEDIQHKLDEVFKGQPEGPSEQDKGQANSVYSLHSFNSSILATRSRILLDSEFRREIQIGLENDTHWADILEQLQSADGHRQ